MTERERDEAMNALISWFETMDINPTQAGLIMTRLMAANFVNKSRDTKQLQKAIDLTNALLTTEVAGFVASTKCKD
jgi:TATA-binding protein-associated factor Taf7